MFRLLTIIAVLSVLTSETIAAVDAKAHGAHGDGKSSDTEALQRAIAAAASAQDILVVPPGVYLIDAKIGLVIPSGARIELDSQAVLRAIPNDLSHYQVLKLDKVSDVQITGGVVEGDRDHHTGTTGEWGHGIDIRGSRQILLRGITIRSCWGDGLYIGGDSRQIEVDGVTCSRNRRQGLSVTSGSDITVRNSAFEKTQGTAPECGIDIEPNRGETVSNCQILNCRILENAGGGIQAGVAHADRGQAFVLGFLAEGCTVERNGTKPPCFAIQIVNCERAIVRKNLLTANLGIGIGVTHSVDTQVLQNVVSGTRQTTNKSDAGLLFSEDQRSTARENVVTGNEGYGVFLWKTQTQVTGNRLTGNRRGNVRQ